MYGWNIHLGYVLSKLHVMLPIIWDFALGKQSHTYIMLYVERYFYNKEEYINIYIGDICIYNNREKYRLESL